MIHLAGPYVVAALLVGIGVAGVLLRRNAVLVLVGIELILSGSLVLLLATGARGGEGALRARWEAGSVLPLFVVTIAAAEVVVALAVILAAFRHRGSIDVDEPSPDAPPAAARPPSPEATQRASSPEATQRASSPEATP